MAAFAYLPVFIFEDLEPLILQNGIKLRNIYHAGINIFSNLSFFYTPRGIDLFFVIIKDGLPYLFHSFRNKYFNKISLGNMLYFQNKL